MTGYVDVETWFRLGLRDHRVLVDGRDVTNRCTAFDYDHGWADVYIDPPVTTMDGPLTERIYGLVTIQAVQA